MSQSLDSQRALWGQLPEGWFPRGLAPLWSHHPAEDRPRMDEGGALGHSRGCWGGWVGLGSMPVATGKNSLPNTLTLAQWDPLLVSELRTTRNASVWFKPLCLRSVWYKSKRKYVCLPRALGTARRDHVGQCLATPGSSFPFLLRLWNKCLRRRRTWKRLNV